MPGEKLLGRSLKKYVDHLTVILALRSLKVSDSDDYIEVKIVFLLSVDARFNLLFRALIYAQCPVWKENEMNQLQINLFGSFQMYIYRKPMHMLVTMVMSLLVDKVTSVQYSPPE